jgi:DHA1 family multidrug resistance protein-like MFS transporter
MLAQERKFKDEGIDRPLERVSESESSDSEEYEKAETDDEHPPMTMVPTTVESIRAGPGAIRSHTLSSQVSRSSTRPYTRERFDVERAIAAEKTESVVLAPTKTSDGTILVDWYTTDDIDNPQNWSMKKKWVVMVQMALYTMAVYGSSSMYVAGQEGIMEHFSVSAEVASLGLALFVVGYGVGPMLWAPLSEIPIIGRNWIYVPTYILFVILSIPTALVDNFAGLMVLRFLTGFFGSPVLANGGATIGDMFDFVKLPIYLASWTVAAFNGPAIGPVISAFAIQAKGWRWGLWEIVWLNAPILVVFFFFYPETSSDNILRRRAARLRKLTGAENIKSQSEINQAQMKPREIAYDALIKPVEIMVKDPAVSFTNTYTALTYGIYYSFFEAFPLVYPAIYGFNLGETGLVFLSISIACFCAVTIFILYQVKYLIPDIMKNGLRAPEHRLVPALIGVILLPIGFFMFGWTARQGVPWIVSVIGVGIVVFANFFIFQSVFIYLPLSYPKYAASLFAANDLSRSMFAAGAIMFARPMFLSLGIGGGVSLLAGLSCLGIFGMFYLWRYGAWLRSKSTFAQS